MALSDYRLCDICGAKAFYDSNLNYKWGPSEYHDTPPFKYEGEPTIRLDDGNVMGWPEGVEADIHYKVCDAGEYWLLDDSMNRIAKWRDDYVPDDILCVGGSGFGDYIILKVAGDGKIKNWTAPALDESEWGHV